MASNATHRKVKLNRLNASVMHELYQVSDEYRKEVAIATKQAAWLTTVLVQRYYDASGAGGKKYRRSFKYNVDVGRVKTAAIVYSPRHYRLTHLLENGHELVTKNGKILGKRSTAYPHWSKAELEGVKFFYDYLKDVPKKVK